MGEGGGPHFLKISSSGEVSGWIWIFPSIKAAEEREGSALQGSDRDPGCGDHPAPTEVATNVGIIVNREGLM